MTNVLENARSAHLNWMQVDKGGFSLCNAGRINIQ